MKGPTMVRMPAAAPTQVRRDLRQFGISAGARAWGISPRDAVLIAAGLPAHPAAVARVLARIAAIGGGTPRKRG